jgi:hypothetical protein
MVAPTELASSSTRFCRLAEAIASLSPSKTSRLVVLLATAGSSATRAERGELACHRAQPTRQHAPLLQDRLARGIEVEKRSCHEKIDPAYCDEQQNHRPQSASRACGHCGKPSQGPTSAVVANGSDRIRSRARHDCRKYRFSGLPINGQRRERSGRGSDPAGPLPLRVS